MAPGLDSRNGRLTSVWDELRSSFGLPAGFAMLCGIVLGFGLPAIDQALDVEIPTFEFDTQDAATGLLETIATTTVAVAGLSFSVTIVAFTLTSQQLSPRVLRSFRSDRLSQAVLAMFLGTFVYCLIVLVRLGVREDMGVPNLSITIALFTALISFGLFALFIAHIARMLQPSTVIATIVSEAKQALQGRFPSGIGGDPDDIEGCRGAARSRMERSEPIAVEAEGEGYVDSIAGERLIEAARENDGLVRQRVPVGDYVVPGQVLAEIWADGLRDDDREALVDGVRDAFRLGKQRGLVQDAGFTVRQLADIALKGLSPGVNDPTTAENAMDAMTAVIIRFARSERPSELRVDADGQARFIAEAPELNDLVRLGFEQVRVFAAPYPVVTIAMLGLLEQIARAARRAGLPHEEVEQQAVLLREGPPGEVPTTEDAERVRRAHARLHSP